MLQLQYEGLQRFVGHAIDASAVQVRAQPGHARIGATGQSRHWHAVARVPHFMLQSRLHRRLRTHHPRQRLVQLPPATP